MDKDYPNAKLEEDQSVLVAPKYSGSGGSSSSIIPMNRFDSEELQKYERKRKVLESKSILADLDLDLKGEVPMSKYGKKSGYKKVTEADLWTPPPHYVFEAQKREMEKTMSKPKSWSQNFREFKAYAETVLDFLRRRGFNANFVCRVATDRDWQMDVRDQSFWVNDLDKQHQSKHYLYRGEAIFYGVFKEGTWKFGLKDLGLASHGRVSKMNTFPLAVLGGDFRLIHQFSERNGDDDLEDPESASNNCGNHRSRRKSIPSAAESRVLNDFRKASMHDIIDEEFD